jgi:eukaryotic-like serine/threonine-protein kinase
VEASIRLADVLRYVGEVRLASGCLDEAALSDPDAIQQAGILRARGRIAMSAGDARGAVAVLQRSLGLALRAGDRDFLVETYVDLAQALTSLGNARGAVAELSEAIDLITLGDGLAEASGPPKLWLLGFRMAELQLRTGDADGAERTASGALELARRMGNVTGQGRLHALLASIVEAAGDAQRALIHRAHALDHLRRLGDRRSTAELLIACARATGDMPPVIANSGSQDRTRLTAKRAMQIAHDLAVEVGWDEGIAMTRSTGESL